MRGGLRQVYLARTPLASRFNPCIMCQKATTGVVSVEREFAQLGNYLIVTPNFLIHWGFGAIPAAMMDGVEG